MGYEANRRVETSVRTFAIVEQLSGVDQAGISELATELEMSKGIVHNHVSTLRELGYVRKIDESYQLTPKLLNVGFQARSNASLYRFAAGSCREFADQLNVGVVLCQQADSNCTIIRTDNVPESVEIDVGYSFSSWNSLVGLVIHAVTNREETVAGDTGKYDVAQIQTDLDADRYAVGPLSAAIPTRSVAVPIVDDDGDCHGSVGVLLSDSQQEERTQRIAAETVSLRNRIESRFNSDWTGERSFTTEKHTWIG